MGDGATCKARKNHGRGPLTIHTSISGFQPPSWGEHVPGRKGTSLRFLSLAAPARRPRAYLNLNLLLWLQLYFRTFPRPWSQEFHSVSVRDNDLHWPWTTNQTCHADDCELRGPVLKCSWF